jgi:recombination protein RecA
LPFGLLSIDTELPEAGLPRGAVVELAAPRGLARSVSLALSLCVSAQNEARAKGGAAAEGAWCAFIDPAGTLFAPAIVRAGVDPSRLLVVRPQPDDLARVALRVTSSRVFSVVVVDLVGAPGTLLRQRLDRWVNAVRKLALAVEGSETTVLLLTDREAPRAMPLPVAMRLEVDRLGDEKMVFRVAKDRRGQVTGVRSVALPKIA